MLVLTRKKHESISIDHGQIEITVVDLRGDKARLGVTAPRDMAVHRSEVLRAVLGQLVHVHFKMFVGLEDETWFRATELGTGCDVKSAGRDAVKRITERFKHLPLAFIHFGNPEVVVQADGGSFNVAAAIDGAAVR